jgi:hypothetical protein
MSDDFKPTVIVNPNDIGNGFCLAFALIPIGLLLFGILSLFSTSSSAGSPSDLCVEWEATSMMGKSIVYFYWYSVYIPISSLFSFCFLLPHSWYSGITPFPNLNTILPFFGNIIHMVVLVVPVRFFGEWWFVIPLIYAAIVAILGFILGILYAISWLFA